VRFAVYARTSSDENQSPEESLRWQLSIASGLVGPRGGEIVAVYHDSDVSRGLPWRRRPEASRLLGDLALPPQQRGWDAAVVGEPQRAFEGEQYALTFPLFVHFGVDLWVPDVGGRIDPDNESHDMIMNTYGGLSKAERRRLRIRVTAQMAAMVANGTGRFLGGRPPYGYRLVTTGQLHPSPKKAQYGIELTRLDPDPETAPVARLIFELRLAGLGFRAIAQRLAAAGYPAPSAHDPTRNKHRTVQRWSASAVRAIVLNPRYKGTDRFGAHQKKDKLLDPADVAAGRVSRRVAAPPEAWVLAEGVIPPLVTAAVWEAAQPGGGPVASGPRPDRTTNPRYALRGLMWCGACGRRMQGSHVRRPGGAERIHYRCVLNTDYPDAPHARSVAVAEARILPPLDAWLGQLFAPERLDDTIAAILAAAGEVPAAPLELRRAQARAKEARQALDRYIAGLRAGVDPALVAEQTRQEQKALAAAEATIAAFASRPGAQINEEALRRLLGSQAAMGDLLAVATPAERRQIYAEAGIHLTYLRSADGAETVRAEVRGELLRVGEGT
jgi:site-specific DNA recombinase